MAKKKYYAVKFGLNPGIYETWAECEEQIKGFSGAKYKSFATKEEAEKYMIDDEPLPMESSNSEVVDAEQINRQIEEELKRLNEGEVIAFVDGSYSSSGEKSGFGVIIIDDRGIQTPLFKAFTKNLDADFIELRNVAAELEGVKEAIKWAIAYKKTKIKIYYDYEGIGNWADGSWQAKNEITRQYVSFIRDNKLQIETCFCKVPAHAGIEYNEMADKLARQSLLEKGYKTYDDGSIYFVGFSESDWKKIVDIINEENSNLAGDKYILNHSTSVFEKGRQRIVITDTRANRVIINCYLNCKSYVQGKQSILFQKIVSTAIELMENDQTVIETLNFYHVLSISKEQVEVKFERLLPNYKGERKNKHYNNLLSAVYNTMLTGYLPDYTFLITPIFRAYEYCLHRILGEKMGLSTSCPNGKNNFSYFEKNSLGQYKCNSKESSLLDPKQLDYLNDLYNAYNSIRHPYSHWSVDDYDTAVITAIEVAHEYINKGLSLINRYYILF